MSKIKSYFQNENRKIVEFPDMIDEKQVQQLDEHIKPYLSRFQFICLTESLKILILYVNKRGTWYGISSSDNIKKWYRMLFKKWNGK